MHIFTKNLLLAAAFAGAAAGAQAQATYCTPAISTTCSPGTGGDNIESFILYGGSAQYISNLNTGCSGNSNNYTFYSALSADVTAGGNAFWSLTNGATTDAQAFRIWADWNNDGTFDAASELMYSGTIAANTTDSGYFTVPLSATAGPVRLRVRSNWPVTTLDACAGTQYGETEDYTLNVQGSTACTGTPAAGTAFTNVDSVCAGQPIVLYLTGSTTGSGISISWEASPNNGATWLALPGANTPTYTAQQYAQTCYRAVVTCTGGGMAMSAFSNVLCVGMDAGCTADSVWPGDANSDMIANNMDAFAVYVAYGDSGAARNPLPNTSWVGQYCSPWLNNFSSGVNHKHADCNGTGLIDSTDLQAIGLNYGLIHNKPGHSAAKVAGLPDLYPDFTGIALTPGATVSVPLYLGTAGIQASNIYALAGTAEVNGLSLSAAPVVAFTTAGFMGSSVAPFAHSTGANSTAWAIGRTNHTNVSGYGALGSITFTVPAGTPAGTQVMLHLHSVQMIDNMGNAISGYNVVDDTATVMALGVGSVAAGLNGAVIIPNPARGNAVLSFTSAVAGHATLRVTDVTGRIVATQPVAVSAGAQQVQLPVSNLAAGTYLVQLQLAHGAAQVVRFVQQ